MNNGHRVPVYHAGRVAAEEEDVFLESLVHDIRYAFRGIRRSPLFALSVAATIGLGLGVLGSGFTVVNGLLLKPIDLPNPYELHALSWDTASVRRHGFRLEDYRALHEEAAPFSGLAAGIDAAVMHEGTLMVGRLVTGDYFQLLGARAEIGRTLIPGDAPAPGGNAVAVLSSGAWRSRFGSDPAIVGKRVRLGRETFDIVGVMPRGFGLTDDVQANFWVPLTMGRAFEVRDPWSDSAAATLEVVVRLRESATPTQMRTWFDAWLRQRFPAGSDDAPTAVHIDSRATRALWNPATLTMFVLIVSSFGMVLLVACANVTNLVLARGFGRQREIAVRLSLGGRRRRVVRQLVIESLVLAGPAVLVGVAITYAAARAIPALIVATFPIGVIPLADLLAPIVPDARVLGVLCVAAVAASVFVSLAPALRVTSANLVRASRGEAALNVGRSHLRTGLVALQIGACALFLVCATGLITESRRLARPNATLNHELVSDVRVAPRLRDGVATRLAADPSVEHVAAVWRPPMTGELASIRVVTSTRVEQTAGFMVVSPEYFPLFDVRLLQGRVFTKQEADEGAAVVVVSAATAGTLWPGADPIGQTLELRQDTPTFQRRPTYASVRVVGVAEDVASGLIFDGVDETCVYFATGFGAPDEMSLLVRGRGDTASVKSAVTAAVAAIDPDAAFQFLTLREMLGAQVWVFRMISTVASTLGAIGLALAFSGTYAVVAFLVTARTREFGIRLALGGTLAQIVSGIVGEMLRTGSVGLVAGVTLAFALVRFISGATPIVQPFGPRPYLIGGVVVLLATATAALLPSLRAGRIDPSAALRVE